jgi:hypothetical protein
MSKKPGFRAVCQRDVHLHGTRLPGLHVLRHRRKAMHGYAAARLHYVLAVYTY